MQLDESHSIESRTLTTLIDLQWELVLIQTIECSLGQELGQFNTSVACVQCSGNTFSKDGARCAQCPPGAVANDEKTECTMCPEAMYYDAGANECMPCDNPLIPNQDRTACVCPAGTFNNTRLWDVLSMTFTRWKVDLRPDTRATAAMASNASKNVMVTLSRYLPAGPNTPIH